MKNKRTLWMMALSLLFILCSPAGKIYAQYDDNVSYDDFYQNLAPYGQWIDDAQYGYVWSPTVDGNFRPYYTNGHWAMTEYGNTWVSDYTWGWAAFHYGRWTFDNYYGWLWIPGSDWGPAWVSWRSGDGFYGWAPLGPGYQFGSEYNDYNCPSDWWVFIPPQYVYTGNYYHYWYGPRGNHTIIQNTTFINNTYTNNNVTYVSGPHAAQVKQVTGRDVPVFHVRNSKNLNTRVHDNEIRMYRPAQIRQVAQTGGGTRPTPPNAVTATQPVRAAQSVNNSQSATPPFRSTIPDNSTRNSTPGTNVSQTAEPAQPRQHNETRPYEWDVNKQVPQDQPPQQPVRQAQQAPQQQQQQQPVRQAPQQQAPPVRQAPQQQAPQQQQPVRQAPPQQQQPVRQAPQQQAPARQPPAQQNQPAGRR